MNCRKFMMTRQAFVLALVSSAALSQTDLRDATVLPTEIARHRAYLEAIHQVNYRCDQITKSFVRGRSPRGEVFVTVLCRDGGEYSLMFTQTEFFVLECQVSELMTGIDCWQRLDD